MSSFSIKISQHTPIIHFQYKQKGATLRGSDVKPRLDFYLHKNCGYKLPVRYELSIEPKRDAGTQKNIFDKDTQNAQNESQGLYFGNQGNNLQKKVLILDEEVQFKFNTYFNDKLENDIRNQLPVMLALENFGARNNKGFGCFWIDEYKDMTFRAILETNIKPANLYSIPISSISSCEDALFLIKVFYSLLKSGITVKEDGTRTDYPSLLWRYFLDTAKIDWENRYLKKMWNISHKTTKDVMIEEWDRYKAVQIKKYSYISAFMGAGVRQTWRERKEKFKIDIKFPSHIFRIPSNLFFKIFKNSENYEIYFWIKDHYKKMLNQKFKFKFGEKVLPLSTPTDFEMEKFLKYAFSYIKSDLSINNTDHSINNPNNTEEGMVKRIDDAISLIKGSLPDETI